MRRSLRSITVSILALALFPLVERPAQATYPGKNGRIALGLDRGSGLQISTIRPNGEGLTQLTSIAGNAVFPDWSPDGTKIAFDAQLSGEDVPCHTEVMDADGSKIVDLTPKVVIKHRGCAYDPSFTPNGNRLVFVQQRCRSDVRCPRAIWSMNLHGRDRRKILRAWTLFSPGDYDLHSPHVSPDGHTVLFSVVNESGIVVHGEDGNRKALFSVRMNGTHLSKVVRFRFDVCVCGGDWAPNGRRIVSSDQAGPTPVPGRAPNLFTVRPDGSGMRFLTHSGRTRVYISGGSYAPNGRWIAYKRVTATGKVRLMKIHPSGRGASIIARLSANFAGRDWGPRAT
jgi:Tol biopolymer transport system component